MAKNIEKDKTTNDLNRNNKQTYGQKYRKRQNNQ
jgi:hypothetical protein